MNIFVGKLKKKKSKLFIKNFVGIKLSTWERNIQRMNMLNWIEFLEYRKPKQKKKLEKQHQKNLNIAGTKKTRKKTC